VVGVTGGTVVTTVLVDGGVDVVGGGIEEVGGDEGGGVGGEDGGGVGDEDGGGVGDEDGVDAASLNQYISSGQSKVSFISIVQEELTRRRRRRRHDLRSRQGRWSSWN
jgi:hypothetical protein